MGKKILDSYRAACSRIGLDIQKAAPDAGRDMTIPFSGGKQLETTDLVTRLVWHMVQLLITIGLATGVYFRMENRVDNIEKAIAGNISQVAYMNEHGTNRSHEVDSNQQTQMDEINRRVTNLEGIMRDLVPKVERIDTNVLTLMTRRGDR